MARRPPPSSPDGISQDDRRLWARITGTVTPPKSRKATRITPGGPLPAEVIASRPAPKPQPRPTTAPNASPVRPSALPPRSAPEPLEPRRQRRLSRERDPIEARIDLHGFGRFDAEDQLKAFLTRSQSRGLRAVLVITGQGRRGGGVIRASVHEWLQAPALRGCVAGFASAHRRHGGDGALYVTLKARP